MLNFIEIGGGSRKFSKKLVDLTRNNPGATFIFLLIIPRARFALLTMLVTCSDHESFADRVTPKYLADDNFSSGV